MKIAQVAPLMESVPPKMYGGTERVVSYLTEELVRLGHDVTLFASGDSVTSAELQSCAPRALRLDTGVRDCTPHNMLQLELVRQSAADFDVVHFHTDFTHFPLARAALRGQALTTLHGRLDLPDYRGFFNVFDDAPLVSISHHQRTPLPDVNWIGTVHHGLPSSVCRFNPSPRDDYLAFLGRISPEKRPDRAIEIARRAGMQLRIAAKVDRVDRDYFEAHIAPLLAGGDVEFVGEIGEAEKCDFLGNARALLFPIDWPEPFGIVMIEAMSCGTPCIAWCAGSVPEIVDDGLTGRVVDSIEGAVAAVREAERLDRHAIRTQFEHRFSVARMTRDYLNVYRSLVQESADRVAA
jgi:glycosyltransferase involved in cell wall biosynthesis